MSPDTSYKPSSKRTFLLDGLLKNVSRSFYLTLRVLPGGLREPIGLAYLLARAADTIADTTLIPTGLRIELLLSLRAQVNGMEDEASLCRIKAEVAQQQGNFHERALLDALQAVLALLHESSEDDRAAVRDVVTTLTTGMEFDLRTFPGEHSGRIAALNTYEELDRYTYLVAGCAGEFWTQMSCMHTPALRGWDIAEMSRCGVCFGKALQITNILRDCASDLRIGRCYLPTEILAVHGLSATDLLQPECSVAARPVLFALIRMALDHFRAAQAYTLAIPAHCTRLRLACLWPILIGLETLALHARNEAWLDPARPSKITRGKVYRMTAFSLPVAGSNAMAGAWIERLLMNVESQLRAIEKLY